MNVHRLSPLALMIAAAGLTACTTIDAAACEPAGTVVVAEGSDAAFDALVAEAQLKQAGVVAMDRRGVIYHRLTPGFDTTTPLPIASASKWIAAATIMTAVDRGELALDDTVARWIPEAPEAYAAVTLRQLLSHSSGMPSPNMANLGRFDTLEESALAVLRLPPAGPPASRFGYGGGSFQVAGLMLERATERPFTEVFKERVADPLEMRTARFGSPQGWGRTDVPFLGGGMAASLDDYAKFLRMMLGEGAVGTKRILSAARIAEMETDQLGSIAPGAGSPRLFDSRGYGLGVWCEIAGEGRKCRRMSSAGAFGAYPWLDRNSGIAGIFLTRTALAKVRPKLPALRDSIGRAGSGQ